MRSTVPSSSSGPTRSTPTPPCRGQGDLTTDAVAAGWLARIERFDVVGSTNDVVMGWLRGGTPEVCVATADEQSAGRGRNGRSWTAPTGASLLLSAGFCPTWLAPEQAWRL